MSKICISKEVDFVVCDQNKTVELIRVAYEIDSPKAYDRETSSLVKTADALSCDRLILIAFSQTVQPCLGSTDFLNRRYVAVLNM